MDAKIKMNFNNNYHIELIDSTTSKVKQSGDFHNIVTQGTLYLLAGTQIPSMFDKEVRDYAYTYRMLNAIKVGSGTTEPSYTDTALANTLWSAVADSRSFSWVDDYTGKGTAVFTFPATSSYVGTVTEVGLFDRYYYNGSNYNDYASMCTRALLTDSEGQPISFVKTDIDILRITVTVELSLTSLSGAFKLFKKNFLIRNALMGYATSSSYSDVYGHMNLCRFYYDLEHFVPPNDTSNVTRVIDQVLESTCYIYASSDREYVYQRYPSTRLLATTITSERYYKGIAIPGIGYWKLPNEEVFPAYTISGITVGTGDGSTTNFTNPLNYFKKDSEKIYLNGTLLTRGVDYTINNVGNKDCLPEISDSIHPANVTSGEIISTPYSYSELLFVKASQYSEVVGAKYFSNANPLYIEYDEPLLTT